MILDTCALLWLVQGSDRLSDSTALLRNLPVATADPVFERYGVDVLC